jgi:hypothetical protein
MAEIKTERQRGKNDNAERWEHGLPNDAAP